MERMKKNQLVLMLAAAVLAIGAVFFIWHGSSPKFSGTYVAEDAVYPFPDAVQFVKDGQCYYNGISATYVYDNGKITFYWLGSPTDEFDCAINGKKMILSLRNGEYMVTYLKK